MAQEVNQTTFSIPHLDEFVADFEQDYNSDSYSTNYSSSEDGSLNYQSDDYDFELSAQEQWDQSIEQLSGLLNFILLPLIGKILGRRFAGFIWNKLAERKF